eukprot:463302-Hanusia_phi.AAC.1
MKAQLTNKIRALAAGRHQSNRVTSLIPWHIMVAAPGSSLAEPPPPAALATGPAVSYRRQPSTWRLGCCRLPPCTAGGPACHQRTVQSDTRSY